ncbi:hypothetical protein DP939_34685 [Spongiactinospora rosea]|uniref:Uncharacterized protein n=1 Tax=Spongiactinospora rosea TaxID=2248750 RepID=A0A366LNM9_9ACTN|nr:hypothetical protein [Spongiactinospora rosea]RBQ15528.1 hypothetical protein DP939_34685 [Spongiactinospora rosea]
MSERADRLVLDYVSKAADLALGVLRQHERLAFVAELRARIEADRAGSGDPKAVARVLARLGDPAAQVAAARARLPQRPETPPAPPGPNEPAPVAPPGYPGGDTAGTAVFPRVVDDQDGRAGAADAKVPAGVRRHREIARRAVVRRTAGRGGTGRRGLNLPGVRLRRAAMATANPMATEGRDARTILKEYPREALAVLLLIAAAVLLPFRPAPIAIFPIPLLAWATAAAVTLSSAGWTFRDRLIGAGAPVACYVFGGLAVTALRWTQGAAELGGLAAEYFRVGEIMFLVGTAGGVFWLAYRLLAPPRPRRA